MTFAQLHLNPNINKALQACGYTEPTPIQEKSIPGILAGKDVIASAQTGTGKTAAFVLPALNRLASQPSSKKTRVLILTPTRELASQITKAANLYGKFLRFNIVNLVGGMPYPLQIKELARGADIIVATPGRLLDHMEQKRVDLSHIEILVLDEADRMLDMGFIDDVKYIAKLTPNSRQTLLFSATLDDKLTKLVRDLLKNPLRIDLSNEKLTAPLIKQELYKTSNAQYKLRLLKHLLQEDGNIFKGIIFSATKINADKLADQLCDLGFDAAPLHGDLKQRQRNRTLDKFRNGSIQFLVATDVAARGIDVKDISHVFNYDMPKFCEDYVHRIGRTGRAGKEGIAISFVLPTDVRHLQRIERYLGQRFTLITHGDVKDTGAPFKAKPHHAHKATTSQRSSSQKKHYREAPPKSANDRTNDRASDNKDPSKFKKKFSSHKKRWKNDSASQRKPAKPGGYFDRKRSADKDKRAS